MKRDPMKATAHDNRVDRVALILDASRPFVAIKPVGHFAPIIGHFPTLKAARDAAARFNRECALTA